MSNKLLQFIDSDGNMRMAMRTLMSDNHWTSNNCSQVAQYLTSKGFDGLAFVKLCGSKFGFTDAFMVKLSDIAFNQTELDELEIELDKMIMASNREAAKDYYGMA